MSKSDWKFVNTGEDYELNALLSKYGYRETAENRELLKDNLPPNTKHKDVENIIHTIEGLEKK